MTLSNYQNQFETIFKKENIPDEMKNLKKDAFSKFLKTGFPTQKWEDWRFTNLSKLKKKTFHISKKKNIPFNDKYLSNYKLNGVDSIIFFNGHYQKEFSSKSESYEIISVNNYFNKFNIKNNSSNKSPFEFLNTAFMENSCLIKTKPNIDNPNPIRILYLLEDENNLIVSPRIHICISKNSSATFIEDYNGSYGSFFQNGLTKISLKDNSSLNHIRIQSNSISTINVHNLYIEQNQNSQYKLTQFSEGGLLSRLNIKSNLNGPGSESLISGLSLSKHKQHIDNNIAVNHNSPNCISNQNFKYILKDNSSGVFNGKTIVTKKAQKTHSNQSNKNLLLSENAVMHSNPQLEIYADDVKCSHGSTTGQINEDILFYLRSRGLDILSSKTLLLKGFASEIFQTIKNNSIQKFIDKKFDNWLTINDY